MADPHPPDPRLRQELLEQYRHANELFHQSREEWEHWLAAHEFRHDERIDIARQKLNDAERKVEEVEERILQSFY
jgi:hypothetical protein